MNKKGKLKWFSLGVAVCILVSLLVTPTLASNGSRTAKLFFRDIKIVLNGSEIQPVNADGAAVEPFIIDGTTYLPVRAVANALGLEVEWTEESSTVTLTTPGLPEGALSEDVIMDANGVKVTYLGIEKTDNYMGGWAVKLLVENTSARNYTLQVRNTSANGFMTDCVFSCSVAAGKSAYDEILYYNDPLQAAGIGEVTEAEFTFHMFDSDTWLADYDSQPVRVVK